ncbi:aryl-alcohol dehydrogenase-like predicted oxidoreductase [Litoreibacter ponti]|uniref:Aryl-alcohol dehydrogenase-like predicted oxidoreductase n=1 Tax=Litoreibacter ponti TaxID=1510457 RepID=A0A2T6BM61_9RHOB|nr:aldo/keto reductase [Litoreibacter ponti]PTX57149.1 aryl-alcohol dehydrogenase-like predicted oxidoreductase [Litoreibacter ponti]
MRTRKLGALEVGAVGLGCMSFAGFYGETDIATSHDTLDAAREHGMDFLDTAELYGMGRSEEVIGAYLKANPGHGFKIATKGGIVPKPTRHFDNSEAQLRKALEGSLRRLGVDHVDLYYIHRREAERPVEEVVETLVKFIDEGKIGGFGFSEIAPSTLRRAHAVHPVMAVQSEYSLWTRQPELGMIQTCAELGVAFVPFSPVARGMFADRFPDPATFADTDFRKPQPRFQVENFKANCAMIDGFRRFCASRGWSPAGAAIAWTLDQGAHLIPIPGTRSRAHLQQLAEGEAIRFTDEDRHEINRLLPIGWAHGDRYSDGQIVGVERYC